MGLFQPDVLHLNTGCWSCVGPLTAIHCNVLIKSELVTFKKMKRRKMLTDQFTASLVYKPLVESRFNFSQSFRLSWLRWRILPHLSVNSTMFSVSQCPERILSIRWVQVRPSRDSILSAVWWGAVTTRQRVMLIIIVPSRSKISGVSWREVSVLDATATLTKNVF